VEDAGMKLIHAIAHLFGWNTGRVVSASDRRQNLWMAFRCSTCGRVSHKALNSFCHPEPDDEDFRE
jgi:hypothetical protein